MIKSTKWMKAFGVKFNAELDWTDPIDYSLNSSRQIMSRIKHLRKWLKRDELLRLVTLQNFSIVYYCSPLWIGSLTDPC